MKWFLWVIGIFWILSGLIFILSAQSMKNFYTKFLSIKNFKPLGLIAIAVGILLFLASNSSKINLFIVLIGIIAVVKGLFFIFTSCDKVKFLINWWISLTEGYYKILGVIVFILGILIVVTIS